MTIFAIYLSLCDTDSVTINKDTSRNVQECPEPAPVSPTICILSSIISIVKSVHIKDKSNFNFDSVLDKISNKKHSLRK